MRRDQPAGQCQTVTATLVQLATGLPVGDDTHTCVACHQLLRSGTPVTVQLTQPADSCEWVVDTVCCGDCSLQSTHTPPSQLLAGTLGVCSYPHTQSHKLCLTDLEPIADRSPTSP
jgi:hypothetical protein